MSSQYRGEYIDTDTGEVIRLEAPPAEEKTRRRYDHKDEFVMVFFEHSEVLMKKITHVTDFRVLLWLTRIADYGTGRIQLTPGVRKQMCEELGVFKTNLSASLARLVKLEVMSGAKSEYVLNSNIFWKGRLSDRKRKNRLVPNNIKPNDNFDNELQGEDPR